MVIKKQIIPLFLIILIYITNVSCVNTQKDSDRPNFIFYLSDDQDQLDFSIYGNDLVETSAVSKLAKEGMVFNNFYTSQAICSPSRSQLLTGMYPIKNGCYANHIPVRSNISSITKYLKDGGYDVYLAGKSHVKPDSIFDWTHYFPLKNKRYFQINKIKDFILNAKNPYCIFIASTFPHAPYVNDGYEEKDILKLPYENSIPDFKSGYYSNIKIDNNQLTEILTTVDLVNDDNTIFIYASDHGISGKWGVYEKGLKTPFVIRWPKKIKPNSKSDALLSFVDIMPTILDIAGIDIPQNIDGNSFLDIFNENHKEINKYVYGLATRQNIRDAKIFPSRSIRDNRYKYILNFNSLEVYKNNFTEDEIINKFIELGARSNPNIPYEELYDLKNDPYEKNNLAQNENLNSIKIQLGNQLRKWMISQKDFVSDGKTPLIKPSRHHLDKNTEWTKVPKDLIGKLEDKHYLKTHY